ncbi:MAG: hypothetical protein AB8G22_08245 [Saprospiraceae bacterium]
MKKYIQQLLDDIEATAFSEEDRPPKFKTLEEDFADVERFIHEIPTQSLGAQIGLSKIQFPPYEKLTIEQAKQIIKALKNSYFSHGLDINIPEKLPVKVVYITYVEALDKFTFLSYTGCVHFDYCPYDNRYCPFQLDKCPCWQEWEENSKGLATFPFEEIHDIEQLDVLYYNLLQFYQQVHAQFIEADSPDKTEVLKIVLQVETMRKQMRKASYSIAFNPTENKDNLDYRQLSEWLDLPPLRFPKYENLQPLERELIVLALAKLYGVEYHTFRILSKSSIDRYRILTKTFTAPMNYELRDEDGWDEDILLSVAPNYLSSIFAELKGKYPLFEMNDYSHIELPKADDYPNPPPQDWGDDLPF